MHPKCRWPLTAIDHREPTISQEAIPTGRQEVSKANRWLVLQYHPTEQKPLESVPHCSSNLKCVPAGEYKIISSFDEFALVTTWTPQLDGFVVSALRLSSTSFDVSGSWASGPQPLLWNSRIVQSKRLSRYDPFAAALLRRLLFRSRLPAGARCVFCSPTLGKSIGRCRFIFNCLLNSRIV